jgi:hypothetical protein
MNTIDGGILNNRNLFLTVLEAGSPRSGYQILCFLSARFWVAHCFLLIISSHGNNLYLFGYQGGKFFSYWHFHYFPLWWYWSLNSEP